MEIRETPCGTLFRGGQLSSDDNANPRTGLRGGYCEIRLSQQLR